MEMDYKLTTNNKEIYEFYKSSGLDFTQTNLIFVGLLKKLMSNIDTSLTPSLAQQLIQRFNTLETSSTDTIERKLAEYRKQYMEDIQNILNSNNIQYIAPLIKDSNSSLIDKTSLVIREILPKSHESLFKHIQNSINAETNKLLSSSIDKKSIDDFISNMGLTLTQSQSTITTLISASETRIENKILQTERNINELKKTFLDNNKAQLTLQQNITDVLKKFEKGSTKGNISEHITQNILLSLYPSAQVDHVGNDLKETGDILLIRDNKPKILIENKDHESKNVPKHEIDKFIRDCEIQNCCGIMLAQHKGISNKNNFELQIHQGNVLLYVHNVNFDNDKIKIAIDIVEHFKAKLDELSQTYGSNKFIIDNDTLAEINKEFVSYVNQKNNMIKMLKDFSDKMNASIAELKMPFLENYLSNKYAGSSSSSVENTATESICMYCKAFVPKSLSQHYRYCKAKRQMLDSEKKG